MTFSDNDMSAILLASHLGLGENNEVKPFSLGEWAKFLQRIKELGLKPEVALSSDEAWLNELGYDEAQKDRVKKLLARGIAVAFALERLEDMGIHLVTMFSREYPILLRKKLQWKTPPVLFYAGNLSLVNKIGIAIVGSRSIDSEGNQFAVDLTKKAVNEELMIFSGGAKGVDSVAEKTALAMNGGVVSYISDSLEARVTRKEIVRALFSDRLLLLSDVKPDVGFTVARAMNRNKFVYASSYGTFVVQSDYNKGGTWTGAMEAIKHRYTKTFVWDNHKFIGNMKLIENGAFPYLLNDEGLLTTINSTDQPNLF